MPVPLFTRLALLTFVSSVSFAVPSMAFAVCPANLQPCGTLCISEQDLCILEPIPGFTSSNVIPASSTPNGGAFFRYINNGVWQWAFRIGIAVAVLNGTFGGLLIVLSNGDSGKIDQGKTRFMWSAIGLLMLLLAGVILEFINPIGFVNV